MCCLPSVIVCFVYGIFRTVVQNFQSLPYWLIHLLSNTFLIQVVIFVYTQLLHHDLKFIG